MNTKIVSFSPPPKLRDHHPERLGAASDFADSIYLRKLVSHLTQTRKRKGMSIRQLGRNAGIRNSIIERAESGSAIPCCHDFKVWVAALGLSWEKVWSDVLDSTRLGQTSLCAS